MASLWSRIRLICFVSLTIGDSIEIRIWLGDYHGYSSAVEIVLKA